LLTAYLEHIEQLINTTRTECDRFYTIFFMIQKCDVSDKDKIFLALTDSEGKA
jgi:hypothetical protein